MAELKPPILCIGATRSGTSMLVEMLGSLPGCCCWYEPNALWRVGHAYRATDEAGVADARSWVRRWIRHAFLRFQETHGGARVIEKSPYNVLRVKYVHAIFPEAKIVHIHRDGRANIRSQVEQFDTYRAFATSPPGHIGMRLREAPPWEWPAYLPRVLSGLYRTYLRGEPIAWFGMRYSGWKQDRRTLSKAQIAAKQWVIAVDTALAQLQELPDDAWMSLAYEQLVSDPKYWFGRITDFCRIDADRAFWERVDKQVHMQSVNRWQNELDPGMLDEAMPILEPMLLRLGYV